MLKSGPTTLPHLNPVSTERVGDRVNEELDIHKAGYCDDYVAGFGAFEVADPCPLAAAARVLRLAINHEQEIK